MQSKDYYKILGVRRNATPDTIKRAYRKLARKYHPDVSRMKNAEDRFKEISEAYEILKNPDKRAAYDQAGDPWNASQGFQPPPHPNRGSGFTRRRPKVAGEAGFGDFFESLFSKSAKVAKPGSGDQATEDRDHHAKVKIDLIDAYRGADRRVTVRTSVPNSAGKRMPTTRVLNVRIPKGVKHGQRIRLAGQGKSGQLGQPAGDLYLEIEMNPHRLFRVADRNVYLELPVTPWEAALGASVKIPTPDGAVELKVPPGSQQGSRVRLKNRGIPGSPNGHLYVTLNIALPPADNEQAKKIYRTMAQKLAFNPRSHFAMDNNSEDPAGQ